MGVGLDTYDSHIIGFQEEISKAIDISEEDFIRWFNNSGNTNEALISGFWDFAHHIIRPVTPYIRKPYTKTALEIGYGGGRLLGPAACFFNNAIGIDIHHHEDRVKKIIYDTYHRENVTCLRSNGISIPVPDTSVDLVYSFIVLQHVEKIDIFSQYLKETYRVLKPGGIAMIYFGRKTWISFNQPSKIKYYIDRVLETLVMHNSYREIEAKINHTNLQITLPFVKNSSKKLGFRVMGVESSGRKIPDGTRLFGGQHGILLLKE